MGSNPTAVRLVLCMIFRHMLTVSCSFAYVVMIIPFLLLRVCILVRAVKRQMVFENVFEKSIVVFDISNHVWVSFWVCL